MNLDLYLVPHTKINLKSGEGPFCGDHFVERFLQGITPWNHSTGAILLEPINPWRPLHGDHYC